MELRHLRYFVAVAEERHFGRAAARLHMAQPPLSQQIQQLEAELGVTLLHRTTRKVDLTDAGAVYLGRARAVLAAVDAAGAEARRVADGMQGRLVVGCVGSATYSLLPAFARALREALPAVDFVFRGEMLAPDQLESLLARRIDLALLRPPVEDEAARVSVVRRDRLIVALPVDHRLARRKRLKIADLREEDLIVHASRGRSVMHGIVTELCRSAGFEPRIRHEVAETSTLVTFVAAGLGVAVVPEPVAELGVPGTTYRPLAGNRGIDLVAAVRVGDDSPVVARALGLLVQWQERAR
ncbi:LysR substrate-binding domain-containing protein [Lentzea flaviverrucosa]|uniref:DNA-binding transcriptional regulator, LysR family n=1 Tax=Lentzea flaviverrucosa TaxID=200379 RepID=A0A1H9GWX4_9PSEU|nr:LysR substrate-binding domain-containing protein [Lentzea flaviverrucosa]RDI34775.1 LysR family transcriptional regulator [Lentzea flaviverrucosa]SEQ54510.1 DNA-binding transcriptional regulator, LysR family [Lentzea flaviverrucosa]